MSVVADAAPAEDEAAPAEDDAAAGEPLEVAAPETDGSSPPVAAAHRTRGRVLAAAAAGVVLAGVAGTVISLAGNGGQPQATPQTPAALAAPANPCGGAAMAAVSSTTAPKAVTLPDGWVWHRDSKGFSLPLPAGWQRSGTGTSTCFADPAGQRSFTVDTAAPVTRQPLVYWQNAEKKAAGLPGYQRVSMGVLLLKRGGADWEYSWQPAAGPRLHTRRVLLATTSTKSFLLQWTTTDQDWVPGLSLQQRIVAAFS